MTNVFQVNVFQPSVFQEDQNPPIGGFMARFPFYYGGAAPHIESSVISTIEHSEHPVNAIMMDGTPVKYYPKTFHPSKLPKNWLK